MILGSGVVGLCVDGFVYVVVVIVMVQVTIVVALSVSSVFITASATFSDNGIVSDSSFILWTFGAWQHPTK